MHEDAISFVRTSVRMLHVWNLDDLHQNRPLNYLDLGLAIQITRGRDWLENANTNVHAQHEDCCVARTSA